MRILFGLLSLSLLIAAAAWAQPAQFDVVSVRVAQPLASGTAQVMLPEGPAVIQVNPTGVSPILARPFAEGGTVTLRYYTMRLLITAAYKEVVRDEYLAGGPGWMDSDHFDVIAKTAAGTPTDTMRVMLQGALAERFRLEVHREQRPMTVFVLTAERNGLKLRSPAETGEADCLTLPRQSDALRRTCHNMTMRDLADQLPEMAGGYIDGPVVDETNLTGAYDFELEWMPRPRSGGDAAPGRTIFDAIEKLGLKLEQRKRPATVIVVDHVEKPDAN